eukprot:GHUV01017085.1.p2 GENE.GHUV01017085.1~~GHUV01017085.1.p2  ORF type:complete len:100 (+),score=14.36 GHUV01017085.1:927-1226(+)
MTLLMCWAKPEVTAWWPSTAAAGILQFIALVVVADFGLYWGHRIQHENQTLWKMHAKHHAIDTPTPFRLEWCSWCRSTSTQQQVENTCMLHMSAFHLVQ